MLKSKYGHQTAATPRSLWYYKLSASWLLDLLSLAYRMILKPNPGYKQSMSLFGILSYKRNPFEDKFNFLVS